MEVHMKSPLTASGVGGHHRLAETSLISGPAVISISLSHDVLRELIAEVIREVLPVLSWPVGRIALTEEEAAQAAGVGRHNLRDLRLTGQIRATKLGRRVLYTRADLLAALESAAVQPTR
jgi:excisionase family DNA binding protein